MLTAIKLCYIMTRAVTSCHMRWRRSDARVTEYWMSCVQPAGRQHRTRPCLQPGSIIRSALISMIAYTLVHRSVSLRLSSLSGLKQWKTHDSVRFFPGLTCYAYMLYIGLIAVVFVVGLSRYVMEQIAVYTLLLRSSAVAFSQLLYLFLYKTRVCKCVEMSNSNSRR